MKFTEYNEYVIANILASINLPVKKKVVVNVPKLCLPTKLISWPKRGRK